MAPSVNNTDVPATNRFTQVASRQPSVQEPAAGLGASSPPRPAAAPTTVRSKVLYVRNVPMSMSEHNLAAYCQSFGRVVNVLLLRDKRHGFVEFEDESQAWQCQAYYTSNPISANGHRIDFAISRFTEITGRRYPELQPPNRILLFTVTNVVYPVNVPMISQVMARYASLEKVVIFGRGNATHCLVQMREVEAAVLAKSQLDGQNIFTHCNTIRVQFSSLDTLDVKFNNERSWDYSNPHLPSGGAVPRQEVESGLSHSSSLLGQQTPPNEAPQSHGATPVVFVLGLHESESRPDDLAALFAVYGNVVKVKIMFKARNSALVQMQSVSECHTAISHLKGIRLHGHKLTMEMSKGGRELPPVPAPGAEPSEHDHLARDYTGQSYLYARHRSDQTTRPFPPSASLYFSNMPHGTTEEELCELLVSSACDYTAVRFLNEQHHMAIVQCVNMDNAISTLCRAHARQVGNPPRPVRVGFGSEGAKRPSAPSVSAPMIPLGVDSVAYQRRVSGGSPPTKRDAPPSPYHVMMGAVGGQHRFYGASTPVSTAANTPQQQPLL